MVITDLYAQPLMDVSFKRVRGGDRQSDEGESGVLIAPIPGVDDAYALCDSKNPAAGILRFTGDELRAAGMSDL